MIALKNKKPTKPKRGFCCSECNCKTRVTHTINRSDGVIERRRRCVNCAHVEWTEEKRTT